MKICKKLLNFTQICCKFVPQNFLDFKEKQYTHPFVQKSTLKLLRSVE